MEKTLSTQSSSVGAQMGVDDLKEAIEKGYLGTLVHQKESPVGATTELDIQNLEGNEQ